MNRECIIVLIVNILKITIKNVIKFRCYNITILLTLHDLQIHYTGLV